MALLRESLFNWFFLMSYWLFLTLQMLSSDPIRVLAILQSFFAQPVEPGLVPVVPTPVDKGPELLQHVMAYMVLAFLIQWTVRRRSKVTQFYWLSCAGVHAVLTERLQAFVPQRWPNWDDLLSNVIGLLLGILVIQIIASFRTLRLIFSFRAKPNRS